MPRPNRAQAILLDAAMSQLKVITGNIFTSSCQTIVNTVNCVGVMGAGLALECRLRYPEMYAHYVRLCAEGRLDTGMLWLFKAPDRWILNFPTKKHWRWPTKEEYLYDGLEKFLDTYQTRGISSIAFPLLGAQHGGLSAERSLEIMRQHLVRCAVPVEIYRHDPKSPDDLYEKFRRVMQTCSVGEIQQRTGLRPQFISRLREAIGSRDIVQLNQLAACRGIGDRTLEAAFALIRTGIVTGDSGAQASMDL